MNLQWSEADRAFQHEVRSFIETNLPAGTKDKIRRGAVFERDDYIDWQKALHRRGWMAPGWPEEHGGTGWNAVQRYIFEEELARAGTPRVMPFGTKMVAPVIYTFGSERQKQHFLPRILSSDDWWCQGYSEPGSGSDLASLQTKAVRKGDRYVINGTKTWTSFAHYADHIFVLARTDSSKKPQEGISFLLVDMRQPGVEVRPIVTIDGSADINMVFFTDVEAPVENLVGQENKGWTYAKFLLGHERSGIAAVGRSKAQLDKLKKIAAAEPGSGAPLILDDTFRSKVAQLELDLMALEYTELRYLMAESAGAAPGAEASLLKIRGTEIQQMLAELLMQAIGWHAHPYLPEAMERGWNERPIGPEYAAPLAPAYFNWRKSSIYGGTNEIQKNIIAKMVLGL